MTLPELLECPLAPAGQHGVCCPLEAGDVGVTSPSVTPQPLPLRGHECPHVGTCEEEAKSRSVQLTIDSSISFSRFRTITGRCNHLARPLQGASHTPLARLLPAHYSDTSSLGFRTRLWLL